MSAAYEQLGPYILEKRLGSGGAATVYKAFDSDHQRYVGLKVMHEHLAAHEETVKRFRLEAQIAQQLDHPRILPIYDIGRINGKPFIAMPYMAGGSLADRFERPTQVNLKASARLLLEIAGALDHAHSKKIIHRDMKLENILLDEHNRPVIGDFGIARVLTATRMTVTGDVLGTPHYMSPEQWLGNPDDIDHRTDLYSFAVMAYLMATGYYPFTSEHMAGFMHGHLTQEPPLPTEVAPNLPAALDKVLLKGLAKDPANRYQSAQDFARAFRQATANYADHKTIIQITGTNPIVPNKTVASPLPTIEKPQPLWRRVLIWMVLMVAILAALTAGMFASRPQSPDPNSVRVVFAEGLTQTALLSTETPTALPTYDPNQRVTEVLIAFTQTAEARPTRTPNPTLTRTPRPTITRTPSPTPTRTPTLTPTLSLDYAEVNYPAGINLISRPDEPQNLIGVLSFGTRLRMIGRNPNGLWLHVITEDGRQVGWVQRGYLRLMDNNWIASLDVTWQETAIPPTAIIVVAAPQNNPGQQPTATLHPRYQPYLETIRSVRARESYGTIPVKFADNAPTSFFDNLNNHDVYNDTSFDCPRNQACPILSSGWCWIIAENGDRVLSWDMVYVLSEQGLRYLINSPYAEVESTFPGETFIDKYIPNFNPNIHHLACVA